MKIYHETFAPKTSTLDEEELYLFTARYDDLPPFECLSDEEKQRVSRLQQEEAKKRYLFAHSYKRKALSFFLNKDARSIEIETDKRGKPFLKDRAFHFNLSHGKEAFIIAIAKQEVGVDIESIRPVKNMLGIATRYFSDEERDSLIASNQDPLHFLKLWCQKEAYLKALGVGFSSQIDEDREKKAHFFAFQPYENTVASVCWLDR